MKKTVSIILAVLLVIFAFSEAAYAFGGERFADAGPACDYDGPNIPGGASADIDWLAVADVITQGVKDHSDNISISQFNVPKTDENLECLKNIIYDTPSHLRTVVSFRYGFNSSSYTSIKPEYREGREEYLEMLAVAEDAVDKLIGDLKSGDLPDEQKILLLHDRIACMVEYDYASYLDFNNGVIAEIPNYNYNAYGPLSMGVGVCQGYSFAFSWCLDKLGIENYYVSSDTLGHGWMIVFVDGKPYHVDVTFDDPVWDVSGRVEHSDLLVSTSSFISTHGEAEDFDSSPVDTTFDDYYWSCSEAAFQYVDGSFYFIDSSAGTLNRLNADGTSTVLKRIGSKWRAGENSYWNGCFSRLAAYKGDLVYSTPTAVYSYDIDSGTAAKIYEPAMPEGYFSIYGMTVRGCSLIVDVNDNPLFERETKSNYEQIVELSHSPVDLEDVEKVYCTDYGFEGGTICSICGKVLAESCEYPATAHVFGDWATVSAASCTENGEKRRQCANCPAFETEVINSTGHKPQTVSAVAPTCTKPGTTESVVCSSCGKVITASQTIPATGHSDKNGDGHCDTCGLAIGESNKCSCDCHKTGFVKFIWKIKLIFYKIFNTHKYCDCGISHY